MATSERHGYGSGWAVAGGAIALAIATAACSVKTPDPAAPELTVVRSAVTSSVLVTVVDADGNPREGAAVRAVDAKWHFGEDVEYTDGDGHAMVAVDPGAWRFATPSGDIYLTSGEPGHCVTPRPCTEATIVVTEIKVTVVDGDFNPVANQAVEAVDADSNYDNLALTDVEGHAMIGVRRGAWRFVAERGGILFSSGPDGHCQIPQPCRVATIVITDGAARAPLFSGRRAGLTLESYLMTRYRL